MSFEAVRAAYASRAVEYIEAIGGIEHVTDSDLDDVRAWAVGIDGRVLDVGSGPGQWTDYLRRAGVEIEGLEPVAEFLADARRRYPGSSFREGRAEELGVADGSLGGILAWYSLIHTDPAALGAVLEEFARALGPGGELLIGFFTGAELQAFDHAIARAYHWPADFLSETLEGAGFAVVDSRIDFDPELIPRPGNRNQGIIRAVLRDPAEPPP